MGGDGDWLSGSGSSANCRRRSGRMEGQNVHQRTDQHDTAQPGDAYAKPPAPSCAGVCLTSVSVASAKQCSWTTEASRAECRSMTTPSEVDTPRARHAWSTTGKERHANDALSTCEGDARRASAWCCSLVSLAPVSVAHALLVLVPSSVRRAVGRLDSIAPASACRADERADRPHREYVHRRPLAAARTDKTRRRDATHTSERVSQGRR